MVRLPAALAGLLLQAAVPAMAAQPDVPAIDYVVPMARQPFASDAAVIWYDSFDDPGRRTAYLEFVDDTRQLDCRYRTAERHTDWRKASLSLVMMAPFSRPRVRTGD